LKGKLLFIDTETGGLDPEKHSLLSIGLVVWENGKILNSIEILINDGILNATEQSLSINKINLIDHRKIALKSEDALKKLKDFLFANFGFITKDRIILAGHNVNFDISFLKKFFIQNKERFDNYFSYRNVNTPSILYYLYFLGKIQEPSVSLDKALELFNIKIEDRHTALADALATAKLFNKLLEIK
jgi:DNA polymerase-3 subunit epsilon